MADDRKWLERQTKLYLSFAAFDQLRRVSGVTGVNMSAIVDRMILDHCTAKEVTERAGAPLPPRAAVSSAPQSPLPPKTPFATWQRARRNFG